MYRPLLLFILLRMKSVLCDGFVEEVACFADGLTVIMNKSNPDLASLMADPKAQPVVYVYGHKTRVQCGTSLKNDKKQVNYNLTIHYGEPCDVYLTNLEPNYRTSEMAIVLENNIVPFRSKQIVNQVHCVYTRNVQTIKFSDVANMQPVSASTGGRPKPKVDMLFRSVDGHPLREARVGEVLEFYLSLLPDNTYKSLLPKECMFSDREDMQSPQTQRITFVQNSCPVSFVADIIDPLAHVNQEVFFSKFKTFRFANQSTVFVHCTVQVCMTKEECATSCFKQINNSNLTAEWIRFRHRRLRRSNMVETVKESDVEIKGQLRVYKEDEIERALSSPSVSSCPSLGLSTTHIVIFSSILSSIAVSSLVTILCLVHRLKKQSKESSFDLYSTAQLRSLATSSSSLVDRFPPHPLHINAHSFR